MSRNMGGEVPPLCLQGLPRPSRLPCDRSTEIYWCAAGGPVGCALGGPVGCALRGPVGCALGGPVGCALGGPAVGCGDGEAPGCGTAAQNAATLSAPPAAFTRLRSATAFCAAVPCTVAWL